MNQISELVRVAMEVDFISPEWDRRIRVPVENLDTKATGRLEAYAVDEVLSERGLYHMHKLRARRIGFARQLEPTASAIWETLLGGADPEFAERAIEFARAEYARCQLYCSLRELSAMSTGDFRSSVVPLERLHQEVLEADWADADAIARHPFGTDFFVDGAARSFDFWCSSFEPHDGPSGGGQPSPRFEETGLRLYEVMEAMALVWVDAAATCENNPARGMVLLGEAAQARRDGGVQLGWSMRSAAQRRSAADHGKRGAEVRNSGTNRLKEWAVAQARLRGRSAKEIARDLTLNLPVEFRDVSEDPGRLVYDAILADRRGTKVPKRRVRGNTARG